MGLQEELTPALRKRPKGRLERVPIRRSAPPAKGSTFRSEGR